MFVLGCSIKPHFIYALTSWLAEVNKQIENVSVAKVLQLEAARRRAVLIRFNTSPVASLNSLSLSVALLERFSCIYVTLRCDLELWPVTLTFDLWPWTFVVCQLCRSQTLYEIWAQSGKPQPSYCSLKFDLMTLNMYHVLRYALG